MDAMGRFVNRENIARYRRLASEAIDASERAQILEFLAEEEAKFRLEMGWEAPLPGDGQPSKRQS